MNAIIVDDEKNARLALQGIIEENFPEINVLGEAKDIPNAVKLINKLNPDLVFLDISMPGYSGLELFKFFDTDEVNFKVIFVTAHAEYAINAFELSAVDYILKPIQIDALKRAISKLKEFTPEKIEVLQKNYEVDAPKKVALSTGDGVIFLEFNDIIYLKADGSYTHFVTNNGKITVTKRIADFERLEQMGAFIRIHRSQIVNYNRIKKIVKHDGGYVIMDNGEQLSVSLSKKNTLMEKFDNLKL